jgi:hypothetical protein
MVSTRTLIIGIVGGVLAAGIGLVLYNNIQHRPTPFEVVNSTEQGRKLYQQLWEKDWKTGIEAARNLPKTNPELFNYDNKTGLYSFKTPEVNWSDPNTKRLLEHANNIINTDPKVLRRSSFAGYASDFLLAHEEEQLEPWALGR